MADTDDMNLIRVGVLGRSVDESNTWTTTGAAANRNTLNTTERIINRAINALDSKIDSSEQVTDGFAQRFTQVVGNETGADQTAFDGLGKNLIQTVSDLKAGGTGGGGTPSDTAPLMDGTAAAGTATTFARGDHVHPSDTTKQNTLVSGTSIKTVNSNSLLGSGNVAITVPTAGTTTPNMDGTASAGSAATFSRSDHRHPTDTSRQATLVSGTNIRTVNGASLLGTGDLAVTSSNAAAGTTNPLMDGTAAPGISGAFSRSDHVHPSDTSRLALSGGTMTGKLTLHWDWPDDSDGYVATSKYYVDWKTDYSPKRAYDMVIDSMDGLMQLLNTYDISFSTRTVLVKRRVDWQVVNQGPYPYSTNIYVVERSPSYNGGAVIEIPSNIERIDFAPGVCLFAMTDAWDFSGAFLSSPSTVNSPQTILRGLNAFLISKQGMQYQSSTRTYTAVRGFALRDCRIGVSDSIWRGWRGSGDWWDDWYNMPQERRSWAHRGALIEDCHNSSNVVCETKPGGDWGRHSILMRNCNNCSNIEGTLEAYYYPENWIGSADNGMMVGFEQCYNLSNVYLNAGAYEYGDNYVNQMLSYLYVCGFMDCFAVSNVRIRGYSSPNISGKLSWDDFRNCSGLSSILRWSTTGGRPSLNYPNCQVIGYSCQDRPS